VADKTPPPDLFTLLGDLARQLGHVWPGYDFVVVGRPRRKDLLPVRMPCPPAPAAVDPDSTAGNILTALDESDTPMTTRELSYAATGGPPTGAVKRTVRALVDSARVKELPTNPRTYELV
jgi:hypothetical protein